MQRGKGERYKTEFNSTRAGSWASGQHKSFQQTPGFLALRQSGNLSEAIAKGIRAAKNQGRVESQDMRGLEGDQGEAQVARWMRELTELTLLDYIFSQQDRPGNIDYRWYWGYVDGDKVKYKREKRDEFESLTRSRIAKITPPADLAGKEGLFLIQKTQLNDNDAGGKVRFLNPAKKQGMLTGLRHYSAKVYNRLMALDRDLQSQGPLYQWLLNNVDLTERRRNMVVNNTHLAANLLRDQCRAGKLRFDLDDVDNYMALGDRVEQVDCQ